MEWINVKDKLPDKLDHGQYIYVLGCFKTGGAVAKKPKYFVRQIQWLFGMFRDNGQKKFPTYWMPLPKPPEDI